MKTLYCHNRTTPELVMFDYIQWATDLSSLVSRLLRGTRDPEHVGTFVLKLHSHLPRRTHLPLVCTGADTMKVLYCWPKKTPPHETFSWNFDDHWSADVSIDMFDDAQVANVCMRNSTLHVIDELLQRLNYP